MEKKKKKKKAMRISSAESAAQGAGHLPSLIGHFFLTLRRTWAPASTDIMTRFGPGSALNSRSHAKNATSAVAPSDRETSVRGHSCTVAGMSRDRLRRFANIQAGIATPGCLPGT